MRLVLSLPNGESVAGKSVLLHSCCAPCSAAIIECMLENAMKPHVFFCNPNIFPIEEYEKRKTELINFLERQNVPFTEAENNHEEWKNYIKGLEHEPERGQRCSLCFEFRLRQAAIWANTNRIDLLTTSLASSRWKNIEQINQAGLRATADLPDVTFWLQNWRRGGLQERRNELLKANAFYNQNYCGCEFSIRNTNQ